MSKRQIRRDFEELHIGQNIDELVKKYYAKKKKEMFLLIMGGIFILALVFFNEYQTSKLSEENTIFRNENGEGSKEVQLEVKTKEGQWQEFVFELQEKEYEEHELEKMSSSAIKQIRELILAENIALNHVSTDLNLMQEIEGFPFFLMWESSRPEVIDSIGHISEQEVPLEGIEVELKVFLKYEEWEKEEKVSVRIYPNNESNFIFSLKQRLMEEESNSRKDLEFHLPESFGETTLQWRYEKSKNSLLLGTIFLILLPFIDYQKDQEIHKLTKIRREELQRQYSEFISKLILYMEAGMNVNRAIFKIAEDYQKKRNNGKAKSYLYEELLYVCRQNKNGLSEKDTYELLGRRCNLSCYKKLSGLLTQHLQKGSYGILENLREEVNRANEERKKQIKKQGEEMGTKLLLPMMLLLGIVIILIMIPACFSFQV